uniref:Gag-pol protein n=1 Tax=Solanum tuberosum TaxID=4113 RepID=M1DPK9_SOLTU
MPPRRAVIGRPARRNVQEQGVLNAHKVQPKGEVTNAEFWEAIRMLSQVVTNQVGQQRGAGQKEANSSRIHEFLRMYPPSSTGSSTIEDPGNFVKELQNVFEVEEEKMRDREEFRNKKLKIGNKSRQQRNNVNRSAFQQKQKGPSPSSASAPAPRNKSEYNGQNSQNIRARPAQSQGSVA